jgi:hypothetical protein
LTAREGGRKKEKKGEGDEGERGRKRKGENCERQRYERGRDRRE